MFTETCFVRLINDGKNLQFKHTCASPVYAIFFSCALTHYLFCTYVSCFSTSVCLFKCNAFYVYYVDFVYLLLGSLPLTIFENKQNKRRGEVARVILCTQDLKEIKQIMLKLVELYTIYSTF